MFKHSAAFAAVALAALVGSGPAWAQDSTTRPSMPQGGMMPGGMMPGGMMQGGMMRGWDDHSMSMCRDFDAHLAGMMAFDEVKLGITEAQRPAWKKLSDSLRTAHEPVRKACTDLQSLPADTTLPARLERMQKMAEAHVTAMRTAIPAIEQFYATLSPEQKKLADTMMMGHGGMGMHQHMR